MRNVARIKLEYYPLPPIEGSGLRKQLKFSADPTSVLDPCAGRGAALIQLTDGANVSRYTVELDAGRAQQARRPGRSRTESPPALCASRVIRRLPKGYMRVFNMRCNQNAADASNDAEERFRRRRTNHSVRDETLDRCESVFSSSHTGKKESSRG
jgi:hypothetical protein